MAAPLASEMLVAELRAQLHDLREEVSTLTECLLAKRVVQKEQLHDVRGRKRALRVWQQVLCLPQASINIALMTGLTGLRQLKVCSHANAASVTKARSTVAKYAPTNLVVVGGCEVFGGSIGHGEAELAFDRVDVLDADRGTWTPLTCMQQGVVGCAAAVLGGCLYVVGGELPGGYVLDTLFMFDFVQDWHALAPMLVRRTSCVAAAAGGRLYVTGGHDHTCKPKGLFEAYDPVANDWSRLAPMPTARTGCACAVLRQSMYVVGGRTHRAVRATTEAYEIKTGTWVTLPPMFSARSAPTAAALGNRVYVVGGEGTSNPEEPGGRESPDDPADSSVSMTLADLEAYDVTLHAWISLAPMPTPRSLCAAAAVGGLLYVVGGATDYSPPLRTAERYNPETGEWTTTAQMHRARARCAVVALQR
mmetsp:Transcript_89289/g.177531  ORF Transcript_89289/g.177531 Transcript_89289/m.177531 type:complete len:420 (-) Transcript_89289:10-1269(-)